MKQFLAELTPQMTPYLEAMGEQGSLSPILLTSAGESLQRCLPTSVGLQIPFI